MEGARRGNEGRAMKAEAKRSAFGNLHSFGRLTSERHRKMLFRVGWAIFWLSCFLPASFIDKGPYHRAEVNYGFAPLFYSVVIIHLTLIRVVTAIAPLESPPWQGAAEFFRDLGAAIIGLCNLLMLISPGLLWLKGGKATWARRSMVLAAVYVCTLGFLVFRNLTLLYGHYVWCLSFVVVATALGRSGEPEQEVLTQTE